MKIISVCIVMLISNMSVAKQSPWVIGLDADMSAVAASGGIYFSHRLEAGRLEWTWRKIDSRLTGFHAKSYKIDSSLMYACIQ